MWTSTLDFDPKRVYLTRFLARFWRNACFTSFAPLSVQNLPRQSLPANNWVRVRNRLAGVCGSDLHLVRGEGDPRIAPAALPTQKLSYPGHEVVGEVIEIGEDVQHVHVGDRVVLQYAPNCVTTGIQNRCRACAAGFYNLCEKGMLPGPQPFGGGWSEEMLLHEDQLYRVSPNLSDEQAVMLEPTAVALHAVLRRLPRPGDQILIIGAGTLGLLTLQLIRTLAPNTKISVLARHPFQVEQATRMGANHIIYAHDSYASIQRVTNAQRYQGVLGNRMLMGGYDIIYDTVGQQKTLHNALRWVRSRGAVVLVGLGLSMMHIDLTPIWFQEIDLLGSRAHGLEYWPIGSREQHSTFSVVEQLIKLGQVQPEQLITHRFALNSYREALEAAMHKPQSQAIKILFDYSLVPASVVPHVRASARRPRPTTAPASVSRRLDPVDTPLDEQEVIVPATQDEEAEETAVGVPAIPKYQPAHTGTTPAEQQTPLDEEQEEQAASEEEPFIETDEATVRVNVNDVRAALASLPIPETEAAPMPAVEQRSPDQDQPFPREDKEDNTEQEEDDENPDDSTNQPGEEVEETKSASGALHNVGNGVSAKPQQNRARSRKKGRR